MSDNANITAVIQTYFDSMYESNGDKAHQAFHPDARIVGHMRGKLTNMSVGEFADFVASRSPSAKEKGDPVRLDILSIEVAGETAVARVRDDYLGMTFLDTLSLLKTDGRWSIFNKLFHVEA